MRACVRWARLLVGVDRVLSKPPRLPQLRKALAAIAPIEERQ